MAVVLRYGLAQRHRLGRNRSHKTLQTQPDGTGDVEMDWVDAAAELSQAEAMVEGVKARGVSTLLSPSSFRFLQGVMQGKDLLKYVKGLLG